MIFNQCIDNAGNVVKNLGNYELLVHEVGHALGLTGFDYVGLVDSYLDAHPANQAHGGSSPPGPAFSDL